MTELETEPVSASLARRPAAGRWLLEVPLILVVVGIVGVAFWGSWGALRDAALAIHFAPSAANAYPFAVDGLIVAALLSSVVLRNQKSGRRYCLTIIGAYTSASLFINILHGLGEFQPDPETGTRPVPHPIVVAVVASLVVGSIALGSHLLVLVGRRRWSDTGPVTVPDSAADSTGVPDGVPHADGITALADQAPGQPDEDVPEIPEPPATAYDAAVSAYRHSRTHGTKRLSQRELSERYGVTKREAAQIQHDVNAELDGPMLGPGPGHDPADGLGDDAVALVAGPAHATQ